MFITRKTFCFVVINVAVTVEVGKQRVNILLSCTNMNKTIFSTYVLCKHAITLFFLPQSLTKHSRLENRIGQFLSTFFLPYSAFSCLTFYSHYVWLEVHTRTNQVIAKRKFQMARFSGSSAVCSS